MQHLVADEADATATEARLAQGRLGSLNQSMPVELDQSLLSKQTSSSSKDRRRPDAVAEFYSCGERI